MKNIFGSNATLKKTTLLAVVTWTLLVVAISIITIDFNKDCTFNAYKMQLDESFKKDLVYQKWIVSKGDVYAPISNETPPNSYLSNIDTSVSHALSKIFKEQTKQIVGVVAGYSFIWLIGIGGLLFIYIKIKDFIQHRSIYNQVINEKQFYLKKAQEIGKIGHFQYNPKTGIVDGSEILFKIFGVDPNNKAFESFAQAIHCDDGHLIFPLIDEAIKNGTPYDTTHRVIHSDGAIQFVQARGEIITNESGRFLVGTVQDVSDSVKTKNQLVEERNFLKCVIDTAQAIILVLDNRGNIEKCNTYFEKLSGYTFEEIKGKNWFSVFIVPEDSDRLRELFIQCINEIHTQGNVNQIKCKDGTFKNIEWWNDTLKNADQEVIGVLAIGHDVTEREIILEKLRQSDDILVNIPTGLFIFHLEDERDDHSLTLYSVNPASESILKIDFKPFIGKTIDEIFPDIRIENIPELFANVCITGETTEFDMRYGDQQVAASNFHVKCFSLPGNCVGVSFEDITDKELLQNRLRQMEKMESLGQLAGGIAHDFNNILGAIIGYADMTLDTLPNDDILAHNTRQILKSGERAKQLVKQILTFCRESDKNYAPIFLYPIIHDAVHLLRASLASSIEIKSDLTMDSQPVFADATKIHEIVMNLCTNSSHAMSESGILSITYNEKHIDTELFGRIGNLKPGFYSVLIISDNGTGMSDEVQAHIFEPFYTTKEVGKGTGLGLSVVYGIVQEFNGDIIVKSKPDKGTTFEIYLPKTDTGSVIEQEEKDEICGGTERIMFIDDEEMMCVMNKQMLERYGYTVTIFDNSMKALAYFKDDPHSFDLIITDQTMPGLNGFELSKKCLEIRSNIPIILCTGYSHIVEEQIVLKSGIKSFCSKPIQKKEIMEKIRWVLENKES